MVIAKKILISVVSVQKTYGYVGNVIYQKNPFAKQKWVEKSFFIGEDQNQYWRVS
jgi:hypothetical protein